MNIRRTSLRAAATLLGSVLVAGISWIAVPADAASIGIVSVVGSQEIVYNAAPGHANAVVLTRAGHAVTVDDVHEIKAGAGCTVVGGDATRIRCTTAAAPAQLRVDLSDGDDSVVNNSGVKSTLWGRAGNDSITGGSRDDLLYGGDGADVLRGRGGHDLLSGGAGNDTCVDTGLSPAC